MLIDEYKLMHSEEKTYWWYLALQALIKRHVRQTLESYPNAVVLDAGCGTGRNLEILHEAFPSVRYSGVDINPFAVQLSLEKGVADVQQASVENLPFEDDRFDLLVSADVLYFENLDDRKTMSEFARVLKKGGALIMNLPAFNCLKGRHDLAVSGVRRYTKRDLRSLAAVSGFRIVTMTYWNMALFPFLMVWRPLSLILAGKGPKSIKSDIRRLPVFVNSLLTAIMKCELSLTKSLSLPFGSSLFVVARKA